MVSPIEIQRRISKRTNFQIPVGLQVMGRLASAPIMKDPIIAVATIRLRHAQDTHATCLESTGGNVHDGDGETQSSTVQAAPESERMDAFTVRM
jgi:hypothetical protein